MRATRFRFHDYPADQLSGFQSGLPGYLASQHPVRSLADAEDYLARLSQFTATSAHQMEACACAVEHHIVPPRFVPGSRRCSPRRAGFVAAKPEDNVLYASFAEKARQDPAALAAAAERQRPAKWRARTHPARGLPPPTRTLIGHHEGAAARKRPEQR
ncbi:MAG: DUF885 family protein [Xanthomonadales bacterium]|nr:DUF885 family protein [Xanthomonadales bacterium]